MKDFLVARIVSLAHIVGGLTIFFTALSLLARWSHLADVLTSFRHLFVIGGLGGLMALLATKQRRFATATAVAVWFNYVLVAPALPRGDACEPNFTVVTLNALGPDNDVGATVELLRQADADLVVVTELGGELSRALQRQWPYMIAKPSEHQAGMGIFSRSPISDTQEMSGAWFPQLSATVAVAGASVRVLAAHPPPPLVRNSTQLRNEEILDIAVRMKSVAGPAIVAGDLNITRQSPNFAPLLDAGLVDTREGHGVAGTWPAISPFRVGIDHVLHTPDIQTCRIEVGDSTGSDHLPLIGRLRL